jgi:hypothetical protein
VRLALAYVLLAVPALSSAAPKRIVMPDPDATVPVLDGQLALALPSMTSVRDVDSESFTLEQDGTELTLLITETGATAGSNFRASVAADLKTQGITNATLQPVSLAKPLVGIEVLPAIPKTSHDRTIFLYGVYLSRAGGTVQVLSFTLSTNASRDAAFWRAIARRIAVTSIASVPSEAKDRLIVKQPAGRWRTIQRLRPQDVLEFHLREVVPLGKPGARCLIRLFGGPNEILPPGKPIGSPSRGKVLSYDVVWRDFALDDGDAFTVVTDQRVPNSVHELALEARSEIWCRTRDAKQLPALRAMIESSELAKR